MIGPKKLSTIRHELQSALGANGRDPILWLEERMTSAGQPTNKKEVLDSLRRFLGTTEQDPKKKPVRNRERKKATSNKAKDA